MSTENGTLKTQDEPVFILITQCLQNGFFLADENRLCLPAAMVKQMLVGQQDFDEKTLRQKLSLTTIKDALSGSADDIGKADSKNLRQYADYVKDALSGSADDIGKADSKNRRQYGNYVKDGPLYRFLDSVITPFQDKKIKTSTLHVIHIKDWHISSPEYDSERNLYGAHCEAGSWDAEPIEGLDKFLKPWMDDAGKLDKARGKGGYPQGNAVFYEVRSDSVFDFRPDATIDLDPSFGIDPKQRTITQLQLLLDDLIGYQHKGKRIYVVMIGVYTDIKIKTLLLGLRTRYTVENLIVSDVLTGSPSLERHLEGLDFAAKVLHVEIIHSLNELASVLNPKQDESPIPHSLTKNTINFRDYRTYFLDKQNILGFQDKRLLDYLELTNNRSLKIYETIYTANRFLIGFGLLFLLSTVILIIARFINPDIPVDLMLVTGGLGTAQVLASFFSRPFDQMRHNLTTLVRLRNYLETYSNISSLLRHHLTLSQRLQPDLHNDATYIRAQRELELLERQIKLVESASTTMSRNFRDLVVNPPALAEAPSAEGSQMETEQTTSANLSTGQKEEAPG